MSWCEFSKCVAGWVGTKRIGMWQGGTGEKVRNVAGQIAVYG